MKCVGVLTRIPDGQTHRFAIYIDLFVQKRCLKLSKQKEDDAFWINTIIVYMTIGVDARVTQKINNCINGFSIFQSLYGFVTEYVFSNEANVYSPVTLWYDLDWMCLRHIAKPMTSFQHNLRQAIQLWNYTLSSLFEPYLNVFKKKIVWLFVYRINCTKRYLLRNLNHSKIFVWFFFCFEKGKMVKEIILIDNNFFRSCSLFIEMESRQKKSYCCHEFTFYCPPAIYSWLECIC